LFLARKRKEFIMTKNLLLPALACVMGLSCMSDCYSVAIDTTPPDFAQGRINKARAKRHAELTERLTTANLEAVRDQANAGIASFNKGTLKKAASPNYDARVRAFDSGETLRITQVVDSAVHTCEKHIGGNNGEVSKWFENAKTVLLALNEMRQLQGTVLPILPGEENYEMIKDIISQIDQVDHTL
jgi:hypothetical protein